MLISTLQNCGHFYDQSLNAAIWEGQERGALRCHEHTSKLDRWMLTEKQIELKLSIIHCWSYYHLDIGRPILHHNPIHECFPFVLRWKGKQSGPTSNRDVAFYRKTLDCLTPSDVDWCSYANISCTVIPENILSSLILWRSKTMLVCFDKAERHLPDRCLKQFGMPQFIPHSVQRWERKTRGVDGGVDLITKMESEVNEWSNRRFNIVDSEEDAEESEYMRWYMIITRRLVGRPVPISSEFQRMNTALRDVANLADTISTRGMDYQQIQTISRIRYIVHDCLIDSGAIPSPQKDLGKKKRIKARGKDRVHMKGTRRRKKKDNSLEACLVVVEQFRRQKYSETDRPKELPRGLCKEKYPIPLSENEVSESSLDSSEDDAHQSDLGVVV
ncbi:hypothetical protein Leryth_018170 [Lithospermum erythrorhizon]|nr:hypothetical protein Leryth_018170 [Lithospermum erythrorhizon]